MIVYHGSKTNEIRSLQPKAFFGENGSVDGVGVNLTSNASLAKRYAGQTGSVYFVRINTEGYLRISDNTFLNNKQAEILESAISELPEVLQYRFATDISGRKKTYISVAGEAMQFYKDEKQKHKNLGLYLDRLLPEIDPESEDYTILSATKEINFDKVSTSHIHRCLNLYDNMLATDLLKKLASGLILERESGTLDYLSFGMSERVELELSMDAIEQGKVDVFKYFSRQLERAVLDRTEPAFTFS